MLRDSRHSSLSPRLLRPVPDPLGLFLRVGRNDHVALLDLIARDDAHCFGFVIEANNSKRHKELRERALSAGLEVILDPRTQPAATVGGFTEELAALPWGAKRPMERCDFSGWEGRRRVAAVAEFAVSNLYTQVLAPTHIVSDCADPWLNIDRETTAQLRSSLDKDGGSDIQLLYSMAIPYSVFRDEEQRSTLIDAVAELPVDGIWLRIDGLGADATANGVRNYLSGAAAFSRLNLPVIADGIGGLAGLTLLACGVAGGLCHGVTIGERVSTAAWRRVRDGKGFGRAARVYVPELDLLLEPKLASQFFGSSTRAKAQFACHDSRCCPRGVQDMLDNPRRHFLIQRARQVSELGRIAIHRRASHFLEGSVRAASDRAAQVSNWDLKNDDLAKSVRAQRARLDSLRNALANHIAIEPAVQSRLPRRRIMRESRPGL